MNCSLKLIISTLYSLCVLGGDKEPILDKLKQAQKILESAQEDMNGLTVAGRNALDTLLGCMLALDAIVGKGDENV